MASRQPDSEQISPMVIDAVRSLGKGIAAMMGPASGTEDVGGQKEIAMWAYRDPSVDPLDLVQQGASVEEAMARAYPYRGPMLLQVGSQDDPAPRIAYAKRMRREMEKMGLEKADNQETAIELPSEQRYPESSAATPKVAEGDLSGVTKDYSMGSRDVSG